MGAMKNVSAALVTLWLLWRSNWGSTDCKLDIHFQRHGFAIVKFLVFPVMAEKDILQKSHSNSCVCVSGLGLMSSCQVCESIGGYICRKALFQPSERGWQWDQQCLLPQILKKNVDKKEKGRKKSYNWETNNRDAAAFNFLKHAVSITRSFQMHQVSWAWEWPWI